MANPRRPTGRQPMSRWCWIRIAPDHIIEASVLDISDVDARLGLPSGVEVPAQVDVLFTRDGRVGRKAEVRWRRADELGLSFLSRAVAPAGPIEAAPKPRAARAIIEA